MLWLAVHLPALSLESFAATLPAEAQSRPLALVESHRITLVNARAAALGVKPGQKRATALALAADLLLGAADASRDAQALNAVVYAALAFTPTVCIDATAAVPVVLLEVQASLRYFGGFARLLQRLQIALRPLGHRWQLASAPTALGAALLARWRDDLARGPHSTERAALRRLLDEAPVWLLGPGREHWEALQGMGLTRLADLHHLPRSGLARRFGPGLLADLDRARGDLPDPREPIEPPQRFDQRIELFTRADSADQLLAGARVLLVRLLAWAAARQGRIARFALVAHPESRRRDPTATPCMLEVALAEPSVDLAHLQSLLAERLSRWALPAPTLELSLHCDALVHAPAPNAELFPSRSTEHEGLVRLVERLQARLGPQGVQQLVPVADHRPERAMAMRPAAASRRSARAPEASAGRDTAEPMTRPLWLLSEPEPLPEHGARPSLDGVPLQLLAGPERIESGWWDGALAARDYFIASAADGSLVWVFRARLPLQAADTGGWFLQGRFG